MSKIVVVLMGGLSGERKISLLTGKACSAALKKKGYKVINLDAKKNFVDRLRYIKPNVVFNALHGGYGENGDLQRHTKTIHEETKNGRAGPDLSPMAREISLNIMFCIARLH